MYPDDQFTRCNEPPLGQFLMQTIKKNLYFVVLWKAAHQIEITESKRIQKAVNQYKSACVCVGGAVMVPSICLIKPLFVGWSFKQGHMQEQRLHWKLNLPSK